MDGHDPSRAGRDTWPEWSKHRWSCQSDDASRKHHPVSDATTIERGLILAMDLAREHFAPLQFGVSGLSRNQIKGKHAAFAVSNDAVASTLVVVELTD
jgi:hypothetical protein